MWAVRSKFLEMEYHRLDLWYFVSFISGIAYYFSTTPNIELSFFILVSSALFVLIVVFYKKLTIRFLCLIFLFFNLGIISSKYRMLDFNPIKLNQPIITNIDGVIESMKPTNKGSQIVVHSRRVHNEERLNNSKIRINLSEKFASHIRVRDEIRVTAKLFNLSGPVLPGTYDFGLYLYLTGINASGYALAAPTIITSKDRSYIQNLRQKIYNRLLQCGGRVTGNFIAAILLGESKAIDRDLLQNMRLAGISHILCVSGLHLSLVAMLAFGVSRFLLNISNFIAFNFNIKIIASLISVFVSLLYLLLSGAQIAASRAFIMTVVFIISLMLDRKSNLLRALGIAAMIIIARTPEYIFYPAFALSFIAVLSLISGYEFYKNKKWIFGTSYGVFGQIKFYIISNIYSSFLASLITAPIIISQFYIISCYCILNNLIAVPIMSFALMPLSILALILMPVGLDYYIVKLMGFFINIIINFASYSNSLPAAVWYFGHITSAYLCIFLFGFFWTCIWQTRIRIFGILVMLLSFVLMLNTKKPDFIFDYKAHAIGVKNDEDKLVIYGNNISKFTLNYWSNWYGQKNSIVLPLTQTRFKSKNSITLAINTKNSSCIQADIQININKNCHGRYLEIDRDFLEKTKVITIYCTDDSCKVN
jgi:competence protein ComEC